MQVSVLASGSAGNSIYVSDGRTSVLVDAGLTVRKLQARMEAIGARPQDLSAVLLSHEHSDHMSGAAPLCRRHRMPLYCSEAVRGAVLERNGQFEGVQSFVQGSSFTIGTLSVQPFSVPHDSVDPVCFLISSETATVGVVTDLGSVTHLVRQKLRQCQLLVLEFNHDPDLLLRGSYPWKTKQRILSRVGHLSNETAAKLLGESAHPGLQRVILAHLSEKNNHPELARLHAEHALGVSSPVQLTIASQHEPTPLFEVAPAEAQPLALF